VLDLKQAQDVWTDLDTIIITQPLAHSPLWPMYYNRCFLIWTAKIPLSQRFGTPAQCSLARQEDESWDWSHAA
jgi:hypothetical protein